MTWRKYLVQPVDFSDGMERLCDPPVGRRIYRPGDIIELDDAVSDIAGLMAHGQIVPYVEPESEATPPEAPAVTEAAPQSTQTRKRPG